MKKNLLKIALVACCGILAFSETNAQQLAFPGAEGFGKYAVGGRGGSVYRVTNLNDSGTGSLRDALSSGNRIIIFDVGGVIKINSPLSVKANTYIAGQTAPGEGITIYGDGISFSGANNTICRYIRVRAGKNASREDAFGLANGQNIIFDHVSVAWGKDETFSVTSDATSNDSRNITIQNCIISQGLLGHSAGGLCEPNGDITIFRTVFIDNSTRNFKMKSTTQYVNNIVYNWKNDAYIMGGNSNARHYANAVSNYFITGPQGGKNAFNRGNDKYQIYAEDNLVDTNADRILNGTLIPKSDYAGGPTFMDKAFDYPELPTLPAAELFDDLIKDVGASLPYRDDLDWYVLDEVRSLGEKGAFISNETELPIGIPTAWNLWGGNGRGTDTDNDGIPDEWEIKIGSNPNVSDAMTIRNDKGGYANIELYINEITAENSQYYLKTPINFKTASVTQNEIQLEWLDVTDNEEGYIIEEKINGNFEEIGRVGKDISTYSVKGLAPETTHIYRIKAYDNGNVTNPTNELTVKTKPIPVSVEDPNTYSPDAIWTGTNSAQWNYSENNWNTTSGLFESGQKILFDESGINKTITLTETIDQGAMFIKGNDDYAFSGTGVIGGSGSVNKTGNGKLTLPANNTYTGATVIWDGVMEISKLANGGQPSSIGASPNYDFNWVWNGGKISYTGGSVSTDRNVALENATEFEVKNWNATVTLNGTIAGEGDFIKSGLGKIYSTFGKHTYTGNTILREGTYELNGKNESVGLKGKLILEGGRFKTSGGKDGMDGIYDFPIEVNGEKVSYFEPTNNSVINSSFSGSGDLQVDLKWLREFFKGSWDNYYGTVTFNTTGSEVTNAQFMINNENNGAGIPNARVHLINGVQIMGGKNESTYSFGALSGVSGTELRCSHIKTAGGKITWIIGGLGTDEEFKGVINGGVTHASRKGTTNIVKVGDGYWRLTNTNKYFGTTTVNGGTLIVNGVHTGDKDVSTYVAPKDYTINEGGTLAGKGSIEAIVTVKSGGMLTPGDFGIGTLTIKSATTLASGSTLIIDVDRKKKTNDKLTVSGKLTIAGDLNIDLIDGEFVNGDAMTILSATSYSGQFANINPEKPGEGLFWDKSSLYTSGILRVTDVDTGIESDNYSELVKSIPGAIVIEGLVSPKVVTIYNVSGTPVFNNNITSAYTIPIDSGIYFVKIENKTSKIIVQ